MSEDKMLDLMLIIAKWHANVFSGFYVFLWLLLLGGLIYKILSNDNKIGLNFTKELSVIYAVCLLGGWFIFPLLGFFFPLFYLCMLFSIFYVISVRINVNKKYKKVTYYELKEV